MSSAARAGPARLAALALLTCSLWSARADNTSQEYYTALINVTVQEPGRGAPLTFRIDRGRYGLDSPKAEVRGQVLAPLPIHGGECWAGGDAGRGVGGGPHRAPPGPQRRSAGGRGEVSFARSPAWSRLGRRLRAPLGFPFFLSPGGVPAPRAGVLLTRGHWTASLQGRLKQRERWRSAKLGHEGRLNLPESDLTLHCISKDEALSS